MIRVGILGAGRHSTAAHGPALKILQRRRPGAIELAAVCDLDASRGRAFAREFGFNRTYSKVEDMLAGEKLDALLAITPLALTEQVVTRLLPRQIPLLIEKPPGTSSDACRRLLELARLHGTPHMISFNRRFNPALLRARAWIAEEPAARRPRMVVGRMIRHARREANFAVGTGIHLIDAILAILGSPEKVSCKKLASSSPDCFSFSAQLTFPEAAAHIVISPSAGAREETLEIHGQDYLLKIDTFENRASLYQEKSLKWRWKPAEGAPPALLDVIAETEAFLQAATAKRPMQPDLADGLLSMLSAESIQRGGEVAFSNGQIEPLPGHANQPL